MDKLSAIPNSLQTDLLQSVHCLYGILVAAECRQTEIMLTAGAESGSGGTYHVDIL